MCVYLQVHIYVYISVILISVFRIYLGFPDSSVGKESACSAGDLGWEDPQEKGKATDSSILAWRIPWTVWSRGWRRVGHD